MTRFYLLLACLLLSACGQKGPLYAPTQKPPITPGAEYRAPGTPAGQDEQDDETKTPARSADTTPPNPAP